jgi:hypothetical protein
MRKRRNRHSYRSAITAIASPYVTSSELQLAQTISDRRFGALEAGRLERSPGAQMARSCAAWSGAAAPAQPGARERDRLLAAGLRCAELRGSVASGTADRCSDVDLCWVVPDEMFAAAVEPPSGRSDPRVRWHRYASTPTSLSQTAAGSSASGWWALRCSGASISTSVQPPGQ